MTFYQRLFLSDFFPQVYERQLMESQRKIRQKSRAWWQYLCSVYWISVLF